MRVGLTIYLLPLLNPVAVAEEAATLDVVTGGRFIFGVGLGYRDVEDQAFGVGKGERVSRFLSHLEVIRKLWAGETVSFDSPYCRLKDARIALRPVQQPHPPIWVAANNDQAVERAAEIGDAWIINPHATLQTIARQMGLYRAARARGQNISRRATDDEGDLRGRKPRRGPSPGAALPGKEVPGLCPVGAAPGASTR